MYDPKAIKDANDYQVDVLRTRLQNYDGDTKHDTRLSMQLCKCCMYLESEIGNLDINLNGEYTCMTCLQVYTASVPLNTPRHCQPCAAKEHICQQCGSLMD